MTALEGSRRWLALYVLCLGVLMIVLDTTIVTVALPSMKADLGFSDTALVWVVNAYMLTFGGFLLLGGRLGDLYGHRRLFLAGLVLFTAASLACGLAHSQAMLVTSRAIQGLGGAVVTAVALSLIMNLFTEDADRAKAMGVYGFICAAGGSIGALLGGVLTSALNWHWVFPGQPADRRGGLCLVPAPVARRYGANQCRQARLGRLPDHHQLADAGGLRGGWRQRARLGLRPDHRPAGQRAAAVRRLSGDRVAGRPSADAAGPVPPSEYRRGQCHRRAVVGGDVCLVRDFSALYLQLVLGYDALGVGLAFVPADLIMAVFSLGLSARIVVRFGLRTPMWVGLLIAAAGLALFARAPVDGSFLVDVLPGMVLLGLGAGLAFNPVLLAAMNDVDPADAGLASGVVNTAFMMGGALGLAVLASVADAETRGLRASGVAEAAALAGGHQLAFVWGTGCALLAALIGALFLKPKPAADGAAAVVAAH